MNRALWYLAWTGTRNRFRRAARTPRGVVGAVVVVGYVGWMVSAPALAISASNARLLEGLAIVVAFGMCARGWWADAARLALRPAEKCWLFSAPVAPRRLIEYKLWRAQGPLIVSAGILALISRGPSWTATLSRLVALVVALAVVDAHRLCAAVVAERARTGHRPAIVARGLIRAGFMIAGLVAVAIGVADVYAVRALPLHPALVAWASAMATGAPALLFRPFVWIVGPIFAPLWGAWASGLLISVLLLVAEVVWLRSATISWPEQAALATGPRHRRRTRAPRLGALTPGGDRQPELAFFWKNLRTMSRTQFLAPQIGLVIVIPALLALTALPPLRHLTSFASGMASMWAGLLFAAGPMFVRNDLRLDLPHLRLLKSFPIGARRLLIGASLPAVITLSALQYGLLITGALSLAWNPVVHVSAGLLGVIVVAGFILVPGMNAALVVGHSLVALWIPGAAQLGVVRSTRKQGAGQFYITLSAAILTFVALMTAPAIAALIVIGVVRPVAGLWMSMVTGAVAASVVATAEAMLLATIAAQALDTLDVREADRAAAA